MTIFKDKKVLFVSHQADFQKFNQPLIEMLNNAGATVHYASDRAEKIKNVKKDIKIDFARKPWRLGNHFKALFQMRKLLNKEKYDLIHTHTATASAITRVANRSVKNKKHKPLVHTAHHYESHKGGSLRDWVWFPIEQVLGNFYTDVEVTISNGDFELAKKRMKKTKVVQISGVGVDVAKFRPTMTKKARDEYRQNILDAGKDDFVIGYVAEMIPRKNHLFLLKAFKLALEENPSLRLVLVGKGKTEPEIKKFIYDNNLESRTEIVQRKLGEINEFYESLDLEISTSKREGLGMHLLEALAVGTPVLASDIDGHNKFLKKNQMFDLKTPEELSKIINRISKVDQSGKRVGMMPEKYSVENSLAEMEKIYGDLLKKNGKTA